MKEKKSAELKTTEKKRGYVYNRWFFPEAMRLKTSDEKEKEEDDNLLPLKHARNESRNDDEESFRPSESLQRWAGGRGRGRGATRGRRRRKKKKREKDESERGEKEEEGSSGKA